MQKKQGEEFLASISGCNQSQVLELIQQARIELIAQYREVEKTAPH